MERLRGHDTDYNPRRLPDPDGYARLVAVPAAPVSVCRTVCRGTPIEYRGPLMRLASADAGRRQEPRGGLRNVAAAITAGLTVALCSPSLQRQAQRWGDDVGGCPMPEAASC